MNGMLTRETELANRIPRAYKRWIRTRIGKYSALFEPNGRLNLQSRPTQIQKSSVRMKLFAEMNSTISLLGIR